MVLDTSKCFRYLPTEIRSLIWEHCVRPLQCGAHFFTFFNSRDEDEIAATANEVLAIENGRAMALAAPRIRKTGKFSWVDDNYSAYLEGQGLWTACWESRIVMLRRYKIPTRRASSKESVNNTHRERHHGNDLPESITGSFVSSGGRCYFTFNPAEDLFCLQPFNFDTINWNQPPFHLQTLSSTQAFQAQHIALEYDPNWINLLNSNNFYGNRRTGPMECIMQAAADKLIWAQRLWFIDHRIHRTASAKSSNQGRYTFRGVGCKFVEVREYEDEWEEAETGAMWEEDVCNIYPSGSRLSIFGFLKDMDGAVCRYLCQKTMWNWNTLSFIPSIVRQDSPVIGVLACELD